MNPGAIKIIWFERARRTGAVQRICTAPRSIPVEQEQDSVLRKGEMSIQKKKNRQGGGIGVKKSCHFAHAHWGSIGKRYNNKGQHPASRSQSQSFCQNRRFQGQGQRSAQGQGQGILRDLGDYEALGRKTNRDPMRLATEIPNPVSDLTQAQYL